jgi:hypothetical protein
MKHASVNEDIVVSRPGYTLPSTLSLPASDGAAPCVVFFAGSGPTDRDSNRCPCLIAAATSGRSQRCATVSSELKYAGEQTTYIRRRYSFPRECLEHRARERYEPMTCPATAQSATTASGATRPVSRRPKPRPATPTSIGAVIALVQTGV